MRLKITSMVIALCLTGCATYPSDPVQQGIYHIDHARSELASGEPQKALYDVSEAIGLPGGAQGLKSMFAQNPQLRIRFLEALSNRVGDVADTGAAKRTNEFLMKVNEAHILDGKEIEGVIEKFEAKVIAGNESGSLPFIVDPDVFSIRPLGKGGQAHRIFERTLTAYEDKNFRLRYITDVISYVRARGSDSDEQKTFVARLPKLHVRAGELPAIAAIAPEFAAKRKAEISLEAKLTVKNADRIFADDLLAELKKKIRGVTWVTEPPPSSPEIVVERIRNLESQLPQTTQTVTYSNDQVDIFSAALLMPKNASYQFDLRSGGAQIEYGYVISSWVSGKKLSEDVVRGKVGGESHACENPRIVNVFGGVSAATFTANDNMRSTCSGPTAVSIDTLREQVLDKISSQVLAIPQITRVDALN